jgi:hypothetical protein
LEEDQEKEERNEMVWSFFWWVFKEQFVELMASVKVHVHQVLIMMLMETFEQKCLEECWRE